MISKKNLIVTVRLFYAVSGEIRATGLTYAMKMQMYAEPCEDFAMREMVLSKTFVLRPFTFFLYVSVTPVEGNDYGRDRDYYCGRGIGTKGLH